jgi:ABC-type molybdate transport system permease subunit
VVSVIAGVLGVLTGLAWLAALFVVPVAYLVGVLIASATHLGDGPVGVVVRLPLVLPTMHVAWGMGYLRGIR